jgi:hypothetical protein
MPRRSILSAAERESLLALPDTKDELIRHYTFSESDLSIIRQRRIGQSAGLRGAALPQGRLRIRKIKHAKA